MTLRLLLSCGLLITSALILACEGDKVPEAATATGSPLPVVLAPTIVAVAPSAVPSTAPLPDRQSCGEIRGTDYRSAVERDFFLANCVIAPTTVAPGTFTLGEACVRGVCVRKWDGVRLIDERLCPTNVAYDYGNNRAFCVPSPELSPALLVYGQPASGYICITLQHGSGRKVLLTGQIGCFADFDCDDFDSRTDAQEYYELNQEDIDGLDADHDGIACEAMS